MRMLPLLTAVFALGAAAQDPGQPGFRVPALAATSLDGKQAT
jgi:hypothetical protein